MMNVAIGPSFGPPLSDKDLKTVQEQLGVALPTDYKQFLLEHNGCRPNAHYFPIADNKIDSHGILAWLFGIHEGGPANLIQVASESQGRVPSELLPIGMDPGGNLLCLAVSGPNRDKIYFWDMEDEADEGEIPSYDNVYFVAISFTAFLDSLSDSPGPK